MIKKLQLLSMALVVSMITANAQIAEVGPTGVTPNPPSEALFDLLYTIDIGSTGSIGADGQAGVIFFGDQYWVSAWASDLIHVLDNTGAFVETFTIPGVTGTRSFTTDGTNIYIGGGSTQIYVVDPVLRILTNTINISTGSDAEARMCTYDPTLAGGAGGFWIGDFSSDIASVAMNGTELSVIPAATHGTVIYGGAIDNVSPGGPFLWIHDQTGTAPARDRVVQIDPTTGIPTGVVYDYFVDGTIAGSTEVLAGGLFISDEVDPGNAVWALVGLCQCSPSNSIFAVELTPLPLGSTDNTLADFSLYPNPASEIVTIQTTIPGEKQVVVFDVLGKKVIATSIANNELDVSSLVAGIYTVQVTQNEVTATKKLIIK